MNEKLPKPALKGQQRNLSLDLHRESGMSKLKKQIERNTIAIPFKRRERNVRAQPNWATVRCEVLSNTSWDPHVSSVPQEISEVPSRPNKLAVFYSGNSTWIPSQFQLRDYI